MSYIRASIIVLQGDLFSLQWSEWRAETSTSKRGVVVAGGGEAGGMGASETELEARPARCSSLAARQGSTAPRSSLYRVL